MSSNARAGDRMAIDVSVDSGSTWSSFGCFSDGNFNKTRALYDSTCGLDPNMTYTKGKPDFKGSATFIWDPTSDAIFDAVDDDDPVLLRIYPNKVDEPTKYAQGLFNVDMTLTFGKDTIKGTMNYSAADAIVWN